MTDAKAVFDRFAEQMAACVDEFNRLRGDRGLHCARGPNRVSVYKVQHPRMTLELEFDQEPGIIRMRRLKLAAVVSDLRYKIDPTAPIYTDRGDFWRFARRALRPIMDACEPEGIAAQASMEPLS